MQYQLQIIIISSNLLSRNHKDTNLFNNHNRNHILLIHQIPVTQIKNWKGTILNKYLMMT